jgi:hypothetical protein
MMEKYWQENRADSPFSSSLSPPSNSLGHSKNGHPDPADPLIQFARAICKPSFSFAKICSAEICEDTLHMYVYIAKVHV